MLNKPQQQAQPTPPELTDQAAICQTQAWLDQVVIGLNLCPFAKRERLQQRISFVVTSAKTEAELLAALELQLNTLVATPEQETTLLIHPYVLEMFDDYNQFLSVVDERLMLKGLEGEFQVASFHPDYQFGGTAITDAENYTNRSPYPMLHILREQGVSLAIASYGDVDAIPTRNIVLMNKLGAVYMADLLNGCRSKS